MRLKTRVLIIISASLAALMVMGFAGLYSMRQSMMEERRTQISKLLDLATAQLNFYHGLETSGQITRDEAQARAKALFTAQQNNGDYFIVRSASDNMLLSHATANRVGKTDPGGKTLDGRVVSDAYREEIAGSLDGKAYVMLAAVRPNSGDTTLYKKLNGATLFRPWGWLVAIGFFVDDVDARFWQQSFAFLVIGAILLGLLAALILRMRAVILRQLGGEPHDASECMKRIANGDLGVDIVLADNDDSSLMASLRLMQMKLINITSAIREDASALTGLVRRFDDDARAYAETRSEEALSVLMRSIRKLGKAAGILHESVSRFRQ
jgi:methyl-accepting chemotaxis protein